VRQADPAALEAHGGADLHPSPREDPRWSRECPKEPVTLWEAHAGAGFCQELWTRGEEPMLE